MRTYWGVVALAWLLSITPSLCSAGAGPPAPHTRAQTDRAAPPPAVTLDAPRHLTVRDYTPRVVLAWTYDGALTTGFEIERAVLDGAPNAQPDRFTRVGAPGPVARTFRDPASHPGMTYVYRIRAVGTGTVSPYSKEIIVKVHASKR